MTERKFTFVLPPEHVRRKIIDIRSFVCLDLLRRVDFGKTLQVLTKLGEEIYIELSTKISGVNRSGLNQCFRCERLCFLSLVEFPHGESISFVLFVYHIQSRILSRMATGGFTEGENQMSNLSKGKSSFIDWLIHSFSSPALHVSRPCCPLE